MDKKTKSQAELYRQERKERIAKAAKKNQKKSHDQIKFQKTVNRAAGAAAIAIAALLVLYAALSFFSVPQKALKTIKIEGTAYTVAEYNYFYMTIYQNYVNMTHYYDEYYGQTGLGAMYTGFDYNKSPKNQTTTEEDEEGNKTTITFAEYFRKNVVKSLEDFTYYYGLAINEGFDLSDEDKTAINDSIEELRAAAASQDYSLNRYINRAKGKGLNEKTLKKILEKQILVENYKTKVADDFRDGVTEDEIMGKYDEDPKIYKNMDFRIFLLKKAEPAADADHADHAGHDDESAGSEAEEIKEDDEAIRKRADEFMGKITNDESFNELVQMYATEEDLESGIYENERATMQKYVNYDDVYSNLSEDSADWLFADERAKGDKRVLENDSYYFVVYVTEPAYRNDELPVDVRHILIMPETDDPIRDEEGEIVQRFEPTEEQWADALKEAEDILKDWEEGEATEEAFALYADNFTMDRDENSEPNGGLYTGMPPGAGLYAEPFEDWSFDKARQPGDTGIIKTIFGYHIMYFVKTADLPKWKDDITTEIANGRMDEYLEENRTEYEDTASVLSTEKWAYNKVIKTIDSGF
ncbi:MAG: peptidylprolyl isomerase [Oscillospiraceae bacterium]|nr:peptidylprolyl isomerase [Oscillospiraceae bacterium]